MTGGGQMVRVTIYFMRTIWTAISALLFFVASAAAQDEGIQWLDNYAKAIEEAKRTQKPIFLEFRCEA